MKLMLILYGATVKVDIPADKPIWVSLSYIYGIGRINSRVILKDTKPERCTFEVESLQKRSIRGDLARIAYCMFHEGRWNERQVIPKWFVEQTGKSSHDVKTPEMRWKLNAQTFSLGWERPALLTGEDGRSGKGIPADARGG